MNKDFDDILKMTLSKILEDNHVEEKDLQNRDFSTEIKSVNEDKRTVKVLATTQAKDRMGDVVVSEGGDFTNYQKNPIVLFGHDYKDLPIGKVIDIKVFKSKIEMTIQFMPAELNIKAEQVFQMFKEGYLNAVSIGFIPKDAKFDPATGVYMINSWEMLELSVVPVPANQEALKRAIQKDFESLKKDIIEEAKEEIKEENNETEEKELKLKNYRKYMVLIRSVMGIEATEDEFKDLTKTLGRAFAVLNFIKSVNAGLDFNQIKAFKDEEETTLGEKALEYITNNLTDKDGKAI